MTMSAGFRLADFDVSVARALSDPTQGWQESSEQCLHHAGPVADGATVTLDCAHPATGRYVTLVLPTDAHPLHFCEMEVLALPKLLGK